MKSGSGIGVGPGYLNKLSINRPDRIIRLVATSVRLVTLVQPIAGHRETGGFISGRERRQPPAAVGDELEAKLLTPSAMPQVLLEGGLLRGGRVTVLVG